MKPGVRALGIAESYRTDQSTLCGMVVTPTGVIDGCWFGSATVGGMDSTEVIIECWDRFDREDIQYLFISGVALAWYNIVDLERIATHVGIPIVAITYEESDGLEAALSEHFDGQALEERRKQYHSLPERRRIDLGDECVFARFAGPLPSEPADIVIAFTRGGGRPEPVRVARLAARAADRWAREADRSGFDDCPE